MPIQIPEEARPRVVTVITSLALGGAETATLRLLTTTRNSFDHVVVSLRAGGDLTARFQDAEIPVFEVGLEPARPSLRKLASFLHLMRRLKPDIISAQMYHAALLGAIARATVLRCIPLVWTLHYTFGRLSAERLSTQAGIIGCLLLRNIPDRIVYVSNRSATRHFSFGFPMSRSLIIPNGYDLARFRSLPDSRKKLRQSCGFRPDDFIIGHIGRVHPMKDHATFLHGLITAVERNPKIGALIVGPGTDELEIPGSIGSRVRRLGSRSEIPELMSACDIGCLSSAYGEAFPNVLAEFLACERPCVATDVGDCAELVQGHGAVVPPSDSAALAEALIRMSLMPEHERSAIGQSGRRHIADHYSIESIAERHSELWTSLIGHPLPEPSGRHLPESP